MPTKKLSKTAPITKAAHAKKQRKNGGHFARQTVTNPKPEEIVVGPLAFDLLRSTAAEVSRLLLEAARVTFELRCQAGRHIVALRKLDWCNDSAIKWLSIELGLSEAKLFYLVNLADVHRVQENEELIRASENDLFAVESRMFKIGELDGDPLEAYESIPDLLFEEFD
jgi:hypothetical protein